MHEIICGIDYDGSYPTLCMGELIVTIAGRAWVFPPNCLQSGGYAQVGNDVEEDYVASGPWSICKWPVGFPDEWKEDTTAAVNDKIPWGCCGGCI